jgi:hypothetical protein
MANGVDEATATQKGQELGDKFTLRSPLGTQDQATAVKAVDGLGQLAMKMQDIPVLGTFSRWIAPFMKVSTNFVKLGVEHSPLSLPDSAYQYFKGASGADENLAHAMIGAVVTGLAAMAVAKDNVTLSAPTDAKQNALWYASGRKPYSVNIPGVGWVPYQYFGPLGMSLMLPAVVKDASTGVNLTKDKLSQLINGVSDTTKMVIAGTPLPSLTGFFNMLNGDTSVNPQTIMADLASQVIPLEAMLRYVAQIVDPIYRKTSGFTHRIQAGIPGLSKNLPAYTTPLGQPESRNATNYFAPYAIGKPNPLYEPALQSRQQTLNSNAVINQANKQLQTGGTPNLQGTTKVATNLFKLPDGTFGYQITDKNGQTTVKQAKTQDVAQDDINKNTFDVSGNPYMVSGSTVYYKTTKGNITSTDTATGIKSLVKNGILPSDVGTQLLGKLPTVKITGTKAKKGAKVSIAKVPSVKISATKLPSAKNVKISMPKLPKMPKVKISKTKAYKPKNIKIAKAKPLHVSLPARKIG